MNKLMLICLGIVLFGCGGGNDSSSSSVVPTTTPVPTNIATTPTDFKVISSSGCAKIDTGIGIQLTYFYENDILDSGDRFVSCYISDASAQWSNTLLYKAGLGGAITGNCQIVLDVDTASGGWWDFTSENNVTQVIYNDSGSAHNGYTYTFLSGDCVNN